MTNSNALLTQNEGEQVLHTRTNGSSALERALHRFGEASKVLQHKYDQLRSEIEELRKRLREKDEEIKRSARFAMLGETAAALAHEVRNPLGALKIFLSLLRQDLHDRPDTLEMIAHMDRSVYNLDTVVSNILHFSKTQTREMAPLNVHALIQEQLTVLAAHTHPQLTVELDLRANPFLVGSEASLRQVFYNLFLNSLQAMAYVGTLYVLSEDCEPESIRIVVQDSGTGFDAQVIEKVFEPFVTTKVEGTGLGLAIVRQIVEQHAGTITVHNVNVSPQGVPHGAEVHMVLPRMSSRIKT